METTLVATENGTITNRVSILETIADELAPLTRKAYEQALKQLHTHYQAHGWDFYPTDGQTLNASVFLEQVLSYLQTLTDNGKTYSTVNKTLSAIKHTTGYDNPHAYTLLLSKPATAFMEGVARQSKGHTAKKAQALSLTQLKALHSYLRKGRTARDIRDRALIAFGIATALRSSNIGQLTLDDISPAVTIDGVIVHIRFNKTDQTGKGHYIPVAASTKRSIDPVTALNEWLEVLALYGYTKDTTPDFPLFPTIRGRKAVRPAPMVNPNLVITDTLRNRLVEAEIITPKEAHRYSSHSLRATFITLSSQAGVNEADIATVSLHTSMITLRGYDRSGVERHAQTDYLN